MRNAFILFILCMIFTKLSSQQQIWDYPLKPGMESWKQLNTARERIDACQVPEEVLKDLETSELIKICLNYPLFKDLYFANSILNGFNVMVTNSNAFQELLERENSAKLLLDLYKKMDAKIPNDYTIASQRGAYTFEFLKIELFLSNKQIFKYLEEDEITILKEMSIVNYEKKLKDQNDYGIPFGLIPTCLIISRIINNQPDIPMSSADRDLIRKFINTGIPANREFLQRMYEAIKN